MANADYNVTIDLTKLKDKFSDANLEKMQESFAEAVALRMRKFVPEQEGQLKDSEPLASNYKAGEIKWDTPYAQDVYNADSVRRTINPFASPHWAEVTKQLEGDAIRQDAAAILKGQK